MTVEELEHEKAKVNEASYKQDFWKNLEAEWKKEVEDNAQSAEWLDDFDAYVPYEQYEFVENIFISLRDKSTNFLFLILKTIF